MSKLKLVFADCFACGMRKTWAENQEAAAVANDLEIEKVPFYADGAAELVNLAIKQGVNIPFFTDGKKCSKNVVDFTTSEKPKAKRKTTKRVRKAEVADEPTD